MSVTSSSLHKIHQFKQIILYLITKINFQSKWYGTELLKSVDSLFVSGNIVVFLRCGFMYNHLIPSSHFKLEYSNLVELMTSHYLTTTPSLLPSHSEFYPTIVHLIHFIYHSKRIFSFRN